MLYRYCTIIPASLTSNPYALYLSANATRGRGHAFTTPEPTTNSGTPISASSNSMSVNTDEAQRITYNPYHFLTLPHTQLNPNPGPTANAGTTMHSLHSLQSMYPTHPVYPYPSYSYSHPHTYPYPPHHYPQLYPPYQYAYPYSNHVVHSPNQLPVPSPIYPVSNPNVGAGITEPGRIALVPGAVSAALPRAVIVPPLTTSETASQACIPASSSASDRTREIGPDIGSNLNVFTSSKPSASNPNPKSNSHHNTITIFRESNPKLKPKKSRKLGVITSSNSKPISIPLIPRDAQTHLPLLPLSVGIMTVFDLGMCVLFIISFIFSFFCMTFRSRGSVTGC